MRSPRDEVVRLIEAVNAGEIEPGEVDVQLSKLRRPLAHGGAGEPAFDHLEALLARHVVPCDAHVWIDEACDVAIGVGRADRDDDETRLFCHDFAGGTPRWTIGVASASPCEVIFGHEPGAVVLISHLQRKESVGHAIIGWTVEAFAIEDGASRWREVHEGPWMAAHEGRHAVLRGPELGDALQVVDTISGEVVGGTTIDRDAWPWPRFAIAPAGLLFAVAAAAGSRQGPTRIRLHRRDGTPVVDAVAPGCVFEMKLTDGGHLITRDIDSRLQFWDPRGRLVGEDHVFGPSFAIDRAGTVAAGARGRVAGLVVPGMEAPLAIWDVATAAMRHERSGDGGWVTALGSNGRWVATRSSQDKRVRLWRGRSRLPWPLPPAATRPRPRPKDDQIDRRTVISRGVIDGEVAWTWPAGDARCWSVAFAPRGDLLAAGHADGTISLCQASTGRVVQTLHVHERPVALLAWSPDATRLASAESRRPDEATSPRWSLIVTDVARGAELHRVSFPSRVLAAVFAPDGRALASADFTGDVRITGEDGGLIRRWRATERVYSLDASPYSGQLAWRDGDEIVIAGRSLDSLGIRYFVGPEETDTREPVCWSPDGRMLACAGRIWATTTGMMRHEPRNFGSSREIVGSGFAFGDGGRLNYAALNSFSATGVEIWDLATRRLSFVVPAEYVKSASVSPDDRRVAIAGFDGGVTVWRLVHDWVGADEVLAEAALALVEQRSSLWRLDGVEGVLDMWRDVRRCTASSPDLRTRAAWLTDDVVAHLRGAAEPLTIERAEMVDRDLAGALRG